MIAADVAFGADVPGWVATDRVARPPLAESSGATWTTWRALAPAPAPAPHSGSAPARGSEGAVAACVATPVPGWVEDMRQPVVARAIGLVQSTAERVTGSPMEARRDDGDDTFRLFVAGEPRGPAIGTARMRVGFDDASRVDVCFAICVSSDAACDASVAQATFAKGADPPPPGAGLRLVTWAVHHPRDAGLGAGGTAALLAASAVVFRRKPRSRAR